METQQINRTLKFSKSDLFVFGAAGRSRTDTDVSPADFESAASASFTTAAYRLQALSL